MLKPSLFQLQFCQFFLILDIFNIERIGLSLQSIANIFSPIHFMAFNRSFKSIVGCLSFWAEHSEFGRSLKLIKTRIAHYVTLTAEDIVDVCGISTVGGPEGYL